MYHVNGGIRDFYNSPVSVLFNPIARLHILTAMRFTFFFFYDNENGVGFDTSRLGRGKKRYNSSCKRRRRSSFEKNERSRGAFASGSGTSKYPLYNIL